MCRLLLFPNLIINLKGFSQETLGKSLQKYEPEISERNTQNNQNDTDFREYRSLFNQQNYSLESLLPGLFLRPEQFTLDSPFLNAYGTGFNFKYYPFKEDLYLFSGMQYVRYDSPETGRVNNFGVNAGFGYDLNENMQIEGRLYHSLYNSIDTDAFQPVQFVPLQPLSLGFKTKF